MNDPYTAIQASSKYLYIQNKLIQTSTSDCIYFTVCKDSCKSYFIKLLFNRTP